MTTITELKRHFADDRVESHPLTIDGEGRLLTVLRALPEVDRSRISARQDRLRATGVFARAVYVSIALPANASWVRAQRHHHDFAWSNRQWEEMDVSFFGEIDALLSQRFALTVEKNEQRRVGLERVSAVAIEQMNREQSIHAALPTAEVDAWIVAHMGYTAESLAALGKATRRDRRREARRQMTETD